MVTFVSWVGVEDTPKEGLEVDLWPFLGVENIFAYDSCS